MNSMIKIVGVLAATVSLSTHAEPTGPSQSEFAHELARDYDALAQAEQAQGDAQDARTYSQRALAAAAGSPTAPDQVELRQPLLKERYVAELSQGRSRLLTALDKSGRTDAPEAAARAQASYDCWLEQASEDLQPDDINACRDSFLTAIATVEGAASKVAVEQAAPPPTAPAETLPENFLVFFDLDRATVTAEGMIVVDSAKAAANGRPYKRILATGHADKSGSDQYNLALSARRAAAVKAVLSKTGIAGEVIETAARGESQPLVPTEDGVREPQNRRVEIVIER